ncbi:hypothetical protein CTEN210_18172 [Chaetoceros tenuissimus]|uniref:Sulphur transport domain-containing protein n=1 Tax=Chaetoceros tenuissimus TaxID=426638 RepID=A0AAD3HFT1_9STRA|nr:hypothetical protein CTEN210_18172 [Chaetoceros tenuissimus]
MINFTPLESTLGGAIIGIAAAILLLGNGDILGCSGIVSSLFLKPKETLSSQNIWKFVHLGTFLLTSTLYHFFILRQDSSAYAVPTVGTVRVPNTLAHIIGGFLVGIGTRLGNGCTSGHGICGLARFSKRSFAAVMTFMFTGIASGSFFDKVEIFSAPDDDLSWIPNGISTPFALSVAILFALGAAIALSKSYFANQTVDNVKDIDMNVKDKQDDTSESNARDSYPESIQEQASFVDVAIIDSNDHTPTKAQEDEQSQMSTFDMVKSLFIGTLKDEEVKKAEARTSQVSDLELGTRKTDPSPQPMVEDFPDDIAIDIIEDRKSTKKSNGLQPQRNISLRKNIFGALSGILFALGLAISGMIKQYKVISFLDIVSFQNWDPSLAFVMGGGFVISFASYQYVKDHGIINNEKAMSCPPLLSKQCSFNVPTSATIDAQLIVGSALFGMGWGIAGFCPGPALYAFAAGMPKAMMYWWPSNIIGTILGELLSGYF